MSSLEHRRQYMREYMRKYLLIPKNRVRHREYTKKSFKAWVKNPLNHEKVLAGQRKWYQVNRERLLLKFKERNKKKLSYDD